MFCIGLKVIDVKGVAERAGESSPPSASLRAGEEHRVIQYTEIGSNPGNARRKNRGHTSPQGQGDIRVWSCQVECWLRGVGEAQMRGGRSAW